MNELIRYNGVFRALLFVLLTSALFSQSACLGKYTRAGGIEPNYRPLEGKNFEITGKATGESSSYYFLWMVPFTPEHRLEAALENAIAEKGGDNIIEITWSLERQFWIMGTVNILRAKGKVIRYTEE